MIKGLGTDLVDVTRLEKQKGKEGFINKVFTSTEIAYCEKKKHSAQHYAARFAAKESYMKALGTGWGDNAEFKEIEIVNNELGKPEMFLSGSTLSFFRQSEFKHIFVSLSHTTTAATATVIITD
jgi:holo-[acyl-carrier protein] synthase